MTTHPDRCPRCGGAALIRSGHACGRQRWRCKGCNLQFTRTTPRGKPAAMKREAIELYRTGLSMNAIAQRFGVAAQSVPRWVRDHADAHGPRPEPEPGTACVVELDELWHFVKKGRRAVGLAGARAGWPADRLGVRRARPGDAGPPAQAARRLGRAPVLHGRVRPLRRGAAGRAAPCRQGVRR